MGLGQNTVNLLFGDHGEMLFDRGIGFGHGKTLSLEEIRVPLILYIPGRKHEDRNDPVSLVDVFSILSELMGIRPQVPVDGINLLEPADSAWRGTRCIYYEVS